MYRLVDSKTNRFYGTPHPTLEAARTAASAHKGVTCICKDDKVITIVGGNSNQRKVAENESSLCLHKEFHRTPGGSPGNSPKKEY